jgi:hypothetical protein
VDDLAVEPTAGIDEGLRHVRRRLVAGAWSGAREARWRTVITIIII